MFGFSWKGLVLVLLPLLPNLLFFLQPAPAATTNLKDGGLFVNILEHGGRIVFYILMVTLTYKKADKNQAILLTIMAACLIIYFLLWARYFVKGREFSLLFDQVLGIPIPMALFPILFYLLSAIYLGNMPACLALILFAFGHIINSCITNAQIR